LSNNSVSEEIAVSCLRKFFPKYTKATDRPLVLEGLKFLQAKFERRLQWYGYEFAIICLSRGFAEISALLLPNYSPLVH
jgi:hypothetical protein